MNQYETHLTISTNDPIDLAHIQLWCNSQELKWTHIVLDSGMHPSQPMVTFWGSDSVLIQQQRANRIAIEIANLRGRVERVKIEASIDNSEVPTSTIDTEEFSGQYFEHHVKVLLGSNSDLDFLTFLATENDARLSQNIRRRRADGQSERFLTQRVFRSGRHIARTKLTGLLDQLADANIQILDIEEEYVLYDTHIMLDSGWLEPKGEMK